MVNFSFFGLVHNLKASTKHGGLMGKKLVLMWLWKFATQLSELAHLAVFFHALLSYLVQIQNLFLKV